MLYSVVFPGNSIDSINIAKLLLNSFEFNYSSICFAFYKQDFLISITYIRQSPLQINNI